MMLRICYLMPRLLPTPLGAVVGGSAANCVSLALELKRQGVDIELLASVSQEGMSHLADGPLAGIVTPVTGGGRGLVGRGLGTLHALRSGLKDRLKEKRFDIVHAHSGTYPYVIVPLAADRRTCVRLHSLYCPLGAKGGVYSNWWERGAVARLAFERLDRVIAVTENVRLSLENAGVRAEKIDLIRMCVDTQRFRPRSAGESPRYFTEDGSTRLLFVGNGSKEKGLLELLQAVRLLKDKGLRVSLIAAVENQCRTRANSTGYDLAQQFICQAHMEGSVRFVGLVPAIEDLYAQADLLVIPWNTTRGPSDYPMVALEAMAMGKCIVSTPAGGCPDLLQRGQAGILAAGFSPQDIAAAIACAIEDPAHRAEVEGHAMKRVRDLSVTNSANCLLALYERLLNSKARHHVKCSI